MEQLKPSHKNTKLRRFNPLVLLFILFLLILPQLSFVPEFWINQMNSIGISALVVFGLVILTGSAGMTSFGQAAFVGMGAYATAYMTVSLGYSPFLGLAVGLLITGVVAWMLGQLTLRLSGHFLPLSTIALCLVFYYLFGNMSFLGRHDGLPGVPPIHIFGISLQPARNNFYLIWFCVLVALWLSQNLLNSRTGRAIRALNRGELMARSFGVKTHHYKMLAFVYAALLAGLAGWLYAHEQRAVSPSTFGLNYGIEYLFMAIIGGFGSLWGAIFGAAMILILRDQIQNIAPKVIGSNLNVEMVFFGVMMVLILQYARNGLIPLLVQWFRRIKDARQTERQAEGGSTRLAYGVERLRLEKPVTPLAPRPEKQSQPLAMEQAILQVRDIRKEFGGLVAVNNISFDIKAGEIMGLIGPNGAGKSTTFNLLTGVLALTSGQVLFKGQDISNWPAHRIAELGVARTFQHVQLLPDISVVENVALGAHLRASSGAIRGALHLESESEHQLLDEAMKQLRRVGLEDYALLPVGGLSLGQQRIVEIARALCLDPSLLLLDEPAAGLRYKEKEELATVLCALRDQGISILLVEHDMDFVMRLTNHLVVMDFGTQIAEGTPAQVQTNPAVLEAYLGGVADE
ncbi:branched-chain amino acid ABC transporter ATP-binding protein/permease [Oligella urethralis]|uniref:branched-chain amino acid ABC transporter ATP-binding protein/permease n=1 Tax=Oligella urethralis TaxID=90245 RepID=UPI0027B9099E|nr:branched-chain amino acid ABC transporter ATP-binding protein/permease [Oligella urethralis]